MQPFWDKMDLPAARQRIINEVQEKVSSGITFDQVRSLIQHPPPHVGLGEYLEGQEQEPLLGEGECPYVVSEENTDELEFQLLCQEDVGAASGDLVVEEPGDDPVASNTALADFRVPDSSEKLRRWCGGDRPPR